MTNENQKTSVSAPAVGADTRPSLLIDYALYEGMLANSDMSDEEKREFLDAIWAIVVCAVDLGFGVHPLQQACESRLKVDDICHLNAADVVTSKSRPTIQTFENAARHKIIGREEGKESWVKINEKP